MTTQVDPHAVRRDTPAIDSRVTLSNLTPATTSNHLIPWSGSSVPSKKLKHFTNASAMKFQPDRSTAPTISGYGEGWFSIGTEKFHHSIIVGSDGYQQKWDCNRFEALSAEHFAPLALLDAEVIIFGSGSRTRFARPQWLQPLISQKIGIESMDTLAACRTYNILATEGRRVVAALLLEEPQTGHAHVADND